MCGNLKLVSSTCRTRMLLLSSAGPAPDSTLHLCRSCDAVWPYGTSWGGVQGLAECVAARSWMVWFPLPLSQFVCGSPPGCTCTHRVSSAMLMPHADAYAKNYRLGRILRSAASGMSRIFKVAYGNISCHMIVHRHSQTCQLRRTSPQHSLSTTQGLMWHGVDQVAWSGPLP